MPNIVPFAVVALVMVCTPGPNMIYLLSRSICQGPRAGLQSLVGTAAAFLIYMFSAVLGITALLMAVPLAYDALRFAGAAYLLYLAWQAVRPGGRSPFALRTLAPDSPRKLMLMGFVTNLLNPKAAVLYLSLLPQFIRPEHGHIFAQGVILGLTQIAISMIGNAAFILGAGSIATFLATRPTWQVAQRWLMGTVFAALAIRMLTEARK
ncbi:MAG: LysE family translocator [Pseudomonadota bacterium]|nr:LysE family translocator [Pseudomonadota bacterium]